MVFLLEIVVDPGSHSPHSYIVTGVNAKVKCCTLEPIAGSAVGFRRTSGVGLVRGVMLGKITKRLARCISVLFQGLVIAAKGDLEGTTNLLPNSSYGPTLLQGGSQTCDINEPGAGVGEKGGNNAKAFTNCILGPHRSPSTTWGFIRCPLPLLCHAWAHLDPTSGFINIKPSIVAGLRRRGKRNTRDFGNSQMGPRGFPETTLGI